MKILHTVEQYSPSIGGAQEVVRQISERLAARGHEVTVATSKLPHRTQSVINGVRIEEFEISGNAVRGFQGETERYQSFLKQGNFDIMMNYAAQQWAADLVFPILDQLPYKKIFIPCGFSGLYWDEYHEYFRQLPDSLRRYDHLIFHADDYRDTNFARQHGIQNWSIVPNGASQKEFDFTDKSFRQRYDIPENDLVILTVGSHTGTKGHRLALDAYRRIKTENVTLIVIGNMPGQKSIWLNFIRPLLGSFELRFKKRLERKGFWHQTLRPFFGMFKDIFTHSSKIILKAILGGIGPGCYPDCTMRSRWINLTGDSKKKVRLLDPPRADVIAAYHEADLFVFGSNIEYSPLVLFESMASKTPFMTLACGNAAEIVDWSRGGVLAPTIQKDQGFVDGDPIVFAGLMDELLVDVPRRQSLAEAGHSAWLERFTWEKIVVDYETLYQSLL